MTKIKNIQTEQRNKNTVEIDNVPTAEILKMINNEDQKVPIEVSKNIDDIAAVVDKCLATIKNNGKIFYIGAGTSGRLGVLDASEILPTFGEADYFKGIIAGGDQALRLPVENAEDDQEQPIKDLQSFNFSSKDLLIGIAASGRTPYVVSALKYANSIKAITASIATSGQSEIGKISQYKIEIVVGAEPISGSTRMKSGTAQKLVLNMISTATMIALGKTYSNYMVDMVPTNAKLLIRATNMLQDILDIDENKARKLFDLAHRNIKIAIIMHEMNLTYEQAKAILAKHQFTKLKNILK